MAKASSATGATRAWVTASGCIEVALRTPRGGLAASRFCKTALGRERYAEAMPELYTRYSLDIAASTSAVWAALTDPALTKQYLYGCEALTDWKVGSPLAWRGEHEGQPMIFVTGRVVAFEPNVRLAYTTFDPNGGYPDLPENHLTVTCLLQPAENGGTRLDWSQGDFARVPAGERRFADASQGGDSVLRALKTVAERL
jgi:uncharacterized protein YndB with AHSA1/START domain